MNIIGRSSKAMIPQRILALRIMLSELEENRLEVCKTINQDRDGRGIRVTVANNCEWYQRFCADYELRGTRKPRTIIKRCHTINALRRMLNGRTNGVYIARLEPYVLEYIEKISEVPF